MCVDPKIFSALVRNRAPFYEPIVFRRMPHGGDMRPIVDTGRRSAATFGILPYD
jgi:hypothetical protein